MLAQIKEDEGDISEAANILQELQVSSLIIFNSLAHNGEGLE